MRFAGETPGISSFLNEGPDYGAVADLSMEARSKEKQTANAMEAKVHAAGLDAMALIKSSKHQARGIKAGGQAQAAATRAGGMSSMFGSIAGGIGKIKFGGSGADKYGFDPIGSQGNPLGGTGGRTRYGGY